MQPKTLLLAFLLTFAVVPAYPADLPPRGPASPTGTDFAVAIRDLSLNERETKVATQFRAGNVPSWLRKPKPIHIQSGGNSLTISVWPDYVAIGSDGDYLRVPLSPLVAQTLADSVDCLLPTPKIVDLIYEVGKAKLTPQPISPSPAMTTVPVFATHNGMIKKQLDGFGVGSIRAGHKKDVVITARLPKNPGKVAIYGWHRPDGTPIQPLYLGHYDTWVDYSHGVRFVQNSAILNGQPTTITAILADPKLAPLLSDEGIITQPRYVPPPAIVAGPGEVVETLRLGQGVRAVINRPANLGPKPALVVFYALPNGNTIEQTIGKKTTANDDWHFDIQQIAAQLRFVREHQPDRPIVIAYLENDLRSWPSWRKANGDSGIPEILQAVLKRMPAGSSVVLSGHSGGGSLLFGYLNTCTTIPDKVERIVFLDSNYAYETDRHCDKILRWLNASDHNVFVVLAYNDAIATLDGKPFVSAKGGTWGRTEQMIADFSPRLKVTSDKQLPLERLTALEGRLTILRHHNPEKQILHTVQVEKNGFIESMSVHTLVHGKEYTYFCDRAYNPFILDK